jgi:Protein of unknown function (DUF4239)
LVTLLKYLLILWAILALGWLAAWWVGKRRGKPESGDFTDALMFVGFSFGLLLSLLQVFVTNHYTDARTQAETEATTLAAMYDDLGLYPPPVRTAAQHEVVCYMRSVVDRDWKVQERSGAEEEPDTVVRGDRLRRLRATLPLASPRAQSAYGRITQEVGDAGSARQQLLYLARSQIPPVLWALVFVSAGIVMFLIVSEFRARRSVIRHAVLVAVLVLLTFEIGSLATLDHPFGPVARIDPGSLTRALTLLEAGRSGDPALADCGPPLRVPS